MRKVIQQKYSDKVMRVEFYDLDEPNELEIEIDDDRNQCVINLTAKQGKKLHKFLKSKYEK